MNIRKKFFVFFMVFIFGSSFSANGVRQEVKVKFTPYNGVKVYKITSGNDNRGVVDLGHFNGMESSKNLNIGNILVEVRMFEDKNHSGIDDFEIVNIGKLETYIWNYKYDITSFIGDGKPTATIRVDNFNLLEVEGGTQNNNQNQSFGIGSNEIKVLRYSFDLILELKNLQPKTMYGFLPRKINGNAYINIQDIITDQIRGSAISKT